MQAQLMLAFLALLEVAQAGLVVDTAAATRDQITPELEPKSDPKFFDGKGADYLNDQRPPVVAKFDHPYPAVQDHEDYEVDYVKDENNDDGEWTAQMEYDRLKNKLGQQMQDVKEAMAKEKEERLEWEAAVDAEKKAEARSRELEDKEAKMQDAVDGADADSEHTRWGIVPATKEVEDETMDLEECKKELEAARKRLAELQAQQVKAEEERKAAQVTHTDAETAEVAAEKDEEHKEKIVKDETLDYAEAKKIYEQELAELKKMEDNLNKWEEKVRRFRRQEDAKGGVVDNEPPKKASARGAAALSAVALFAAAIANL